MDTTNSTCVESAQCDDDTMHCTSGTCQCKPGYILPFSGSNCRRPASLGQPCSISETTCVDVRGSRLFTTCDSTEKICKCTEYSMDINGVCISRSEMGTCQEDFECQARNTSRFCNLVTGYCDCDKGYTAYASDCLEVGLKLGEGCYVSAQCSSDYCLNGKCSCGTQSTEEECKTGGAVKLGGNIFYLSCVTIFLFSFLSRLIVA